MRIVQTPARFYPYIGGTEQVAFYLSKQLIKRGHRVKVICANEPKLGDGVIENIEIKRIGYIGKIANSNITLSLVSELLREDFDVLHTHLPHPWAADISSLASFLKKKPLFLTYHNDITGQGLNKCIANIYNFTALKFLLKRACKIFVTRRDYIDKSLLLKKFRDKIVVTPPGVDLEKFKPQDVDKRDHNSVFFLSKLDQFHRYKGLDFLLQSLKNLIPRIPLKLYIGGEGELLEHYKKVVKENCLSDAVVFLGKLNGQEVVDQYNLCDLFVLPSTTSIQEGFGLVALEAMACGKPVIVSDIVGVADDVITNKLGVVVKPRNVGQLSKALEYLFSNKHRLEVMGACAYDLVRRKYTWEKHAAIVEKEYLRIVK